MPTSPSTDPITPGAWQGSHWSANFEVTGMTRPRKNPGASGIRTRDLPQSRRTPNHKVNEAVMSREYCQALGAAEEADSEKDLVIPAFIQTLSQNMFLSVVFSQQFFL